MLPRSQKDTSKLNREGKENHFNKRKEKKNISWA